MAWPPLFASRLRLAEPPAWPMKPVTDDEVQRGCWRPGETVHCTNSPVVASTALGGPSLLSSGGGGEAAAGGLGGMLESFYNLTLDTLAAAKNDRLWFKINVKLGKPVRAPPSHTHPCQAWWPVCMLCCCC